MADNSSNNPGGRRNWRDRIGVKKGIPRLSDEFARKRDPALDAGRKPPVTQAKPAQPAATAHRERPAPAPAPTAAAPRAPIKPVAKPAPMAPRRAVEHPAPAAPRPHAPTRPQAPASQPSGSKPDAFGERLRAQRAAAEELANRRAAETRQRLTSMAGQPASDGPRFSFSPSEIEAAEREKRRVENQHTQEASEPKAEAAPQAQPAPPPRPARRPPLSGISGAPRPYQPSDTYRKSYGYQEYDRPASSVQPPADDFDRPPAPPPQRPAYVPPAERPGYRSPHSRELEQIGAGDDELFDDNRSGLQTRPRRASQEDYSAAYRDYDDAFEMEEPTRKSGVWIFLLLLIIVLAAAGAGSYWYVQNSIKNGVKTGGKVPTLTAPQEPAKVTPRVDPQPGTSGPVKRKKIYDRILGDQTLEPERIVPTEEKPALPPVVTPVQPSSPETVPGVQPLPLPLPPPPTLPGQQGAAPSTGNKVARTQIGSPPGQVISQTSAPPATQVLTTTNQNTGGSQAPLPLPGVETPAISTSTAAPVAQVPLPKAKPRSVIASAQRAAERKRLAALSRSSSAQQPTVPVAPIARAPITGSGPVQLAPGRAVQGGNNFSAVRPIQPPVAPLPRTVSPPVASLPAAPRATTPQASGQNYVIQFASFRNRDQAVAESRRLLSRHGRLLSGLREQIVERDLGDAGKFYILRMGSIPSRARAAQLCNSLIASGEKDCLARKQ